MNSRNEIYDRGPDPIAVNINRMTCLNKNFRTVLWTGEHMQLTLMNISVSGDIGVECHELVDQFICIESGSALIQTGSDRGSLERRAHVGKGYAAVIPAGTWHNVTNIGRVPLKLYSVYAPVQHPFGTVHRTRREADEAEY